MKLHSVNVKYALAKGLCIISPDETRIAVEQINRDDTGYVACNMVERKCMALTGSFND